MQIFFLVFFVLDWRGVGLTFDDGPTQTSYKIADYLYETSIPAMFFPKGTMLVGQNRLFISYALARGFSFGNHTYDHCEANKTKADIFFRSFEKQHKILRDLGAFPVWFRFPSGIRNKSLEKKILFSGYEGVAGWDVFSGDIKKEPVSVTYQRTRRVLKKRKRATILFHDCSPLAEVRLKRFVADVASHNVLALFGRNQFWIFFERPENTLKERLK